MTVDTELAAWQQEWREHTEPLPELKKKIKRQNARMATAVGLTVVCLIFSTTEAWLGRGSFMAGLAVGIWFASLSMGGYSWWVRRGAWKPTAQTTLAYAELSYKRAVARARTLRFAFYFLLVTTILYAGFAIWDWKAFPAGPVLAAMVIELFFFRHVSRRQKRHVEEASKLMEQTREYSDVAPTER